MSVNPAHAQFGAVVRKSRFSRSPARMPSSVEHRGAPGAVAARNDRQTLRTQGPADRLDPVVIGTHHVDEPADQWWRGSSCLAKKIDADLRISLGSVSVLTSAPNRLISASSSLVGPVRSPLSIWACATHRRKVSVPIPGFGLSRGPQPTARNTPRVDPGPAWSLAPAVPRGTASAWPTSFTHKEAA